MPRDPNDLAGLAEIARMAGVVPSAVSNWQKRHRDFPRPWGRWACGDLYLVADVKTYLRAHGYATAP